MTELCAAFAIVRKGRDPHRHSGPLFCLLRMTCTPKTVTQLEATSLFFILKCISRDHAAFQRVQMLISLPMAVGPDSIPFRTDGSGGWSTGWDDGLRVY
jgi:hypothetical protein